MANNNKGWGNAPQESTTAGNTGWGSAPQESTTAGPKGGWGSAPQESTTAGPKGGWGSAPQESTTGSKPKSTGRGEAPVYNVYVLDNVTFNVKRLISEESGEAIILEVENDGTRYALKLYRSGVVPNHEVLQRIMEQRGNGLLIDIFAHGTWRDDKTGREYHYELMEHCSGGSLASVNVHGDESRLREIATRMASAIDFAHSKGVLHRDVKPANFLFVDKDQKRFVLSDWGLAKTLDKQGRAQTDAGRTKIYAAPEMYTYIPGTPTYVGPKADFFSMGMALLALWMGEGKLLADETKLVHDKQEETLPYPRRGEMSDHTLGLIKALTRRNPEVRAGFDEIIRWAKGENIFVDKTDDSLMEFKIVFNATEGLIAHNPKELSEIMWANPDLATKYLYSDKIAKWFRDIERPELAMAMEDITEKRFPGSREKGLYAACLTLDPEMPYWIRTSKGVYKFNTLKELGDAFEKGIIDGANLKAIEGEDFLMWVATRDAALAGKAMQAKGGWNIIYSIFPDRGFDFKPISSSKLATPEQIAQEIVDEIGGSSDGTVVNSVGNEFRDSQLYAYLKSKGRYDNQIKWIEYCLEVNSKDNRMKYVPYTYRVARLKAAAGLMGSVPPLKIRGKTFLNPAYVINADISCFDEDEQDIIADWSSLFYQEDPKADYKKRTYFQRASDFSYFIDNLPGCTYSQNAKEQGEDMNLSLALYHKLWRQIKTWRWVAGIFCFLPLLLVMGAGIYLTITMGSLDFSESLGNVGHYIGIGVGILAFLLVVGNDYGFLVGGFVGFLTYWLIHIAFRFIGAIVPWIIIAVMLLVLIYFGRKVFFGAKKDLEDRYTSLDWDETIDRYIVGISFDCLDKVYPGDVPDDYPCCVIDESSDVALEELPVVRRSAILMFVMTLIGAGLCWFTVKGMDETSVYRAEGTELLSGQFSGDVYGTPATITFTREGSEELKAQMNIRYQSGATDQTMTGSVSESFPVMLYKTDNKDIYLRLDTAYTIGSTTLVKGEYCNSKKNLRTVNIKKK